MKALNDYEVEQVEAIAAWKSERPSVLMDSFRSLARPLANLFKKAVPGRAVRAILNEVEKRAEAHENFADILKIAGASRIHDLWYRPLEVCDGLADEVSTKAEHAAILEGSVPSIGGLLIPGVGGEAATMVDVPILFEAAVKAIRRIGHCYGFPLDNEAGRRFVLQVLDIANQDGKEKVDEDDQALRLVDSPEENSNSPARIDGIEREVLEDVPLDLVPVLGEISNLVLDYAFICRVDEAARRVFQERWLRTHGKIGEPILPAAVSQRRSALEGVVGVASELTYMGAYGVAFGVSFPVLVVGNLAAAAAPATVRQGFRDGAAAASHDASEFIEGFRHGDAIDDSARPAAPALG